MENDREIMKRWGLQRKNFARLYFTILNVKVKILSLIFHFNILINTENHASITSLDFLKQNLFILT